MRNSRVLPISLAFRFLPTPPKDRIDERQTMTVDHGLDLVLGPGRPKHFGRGKADMGQQPRTREHSGHLHRGYSFGS